MFEHSKITAINLAYNYNSKAAIRRGHKDDVRQNDILKPVNCAIINLQRKACHRNYCIVINDVSNGSNTPYKVIIRAGIQNRGHPSAR